MLDSIEGYLDNIAAAATQTTANGGPLVEFAASLAISVDTVARHQQKIKRYLEQISALKKKGAFVTSGATVTGETILFTNIVKRLAKRRHIVKTRVNSTRRKI